MQSIFGYLTLFLLLVHPGDSLRGQVVVDSILPLPAAEITAQRIRSQTVGSSYGEWTSRELAKLSSSNLAELLANEAGIYVKSYGLGSLATSSIRGGSAEHTLITWNGLPIQSPMLGQLDLSLLPLAGLSSVSLTRGGNAALWGSGASGGVLNLSQEAPVAPGWWAQVGSEAGSFGHFQQEVALGLGGAKLQSQTRFLHREARNDFFYFVAENLPERQQTNAHLDQQYLLQDVYWRVSKNGRLAAHLWWQQSDRDIPPTNVQTRSEARQEDRATRLMLDYRQITRRGMWRIKAAYFEEHLDFNDDFMSIESLSRFRTYLAEATGQWNWGRHRLLLGNTHSRTEAWSGGYGEEVPSEYKMALFASWRYESKRWRGQFSLRQEMVSDRWVPTVPALGVEYRLAKGWKLRGKVSRNYRLPTFNSRFWRPGGDPDLLPESGWSQELGMDYAVEKRRWQWRFSVTAFNRNIENWILWAQLEGQSFWSANNIARVWSRGIEPRFSLTHQRGPWRGRIALGYDHIRSTNQVSLDRPRIEAGQQLIYNPIHQAFAQATLGWRDWELTYGQHYQGPTRAVNEDLPSYQVGRLRLQYRTQLGRYRAQAYCNLNNLWDVDYFIVERRPMPGIHFQLGFRLSFTQKPSDAQP